MLMRYNQADGTVMEFELGDRPITIGRSPDADVVILDEKASRLHCGVRYWDGAFYIKDLKSRNGTYLNGVRVDDMAKMSPGDKVRVGSITFSFEANPAKGPDTVLHEMEGEMALGKGYGTILREIVGTSNEEKPTPIRKKSDSPLKVKIRKD